MSKHTTLTDIRRIIKLYNDGVSTDEIQKIIKVDFDEIERIIEFKTAPKKTRSKKTT
jgi:DNA invertase Pin-like site-specific DNA recombinase